MDVQQLERQGAGLLLTAAVLSVNSKTAVKFADYCRRVIASYLASINWKREIAVRKL